jgi:penicillin-binding protein 1A
METALKGVPVMEPAAPEGLVNVNGEWYYEEYARGNGVASLGLAGGDNALGPDGLPRQRSGGSQGEQAPGVPGDRSMMNSNGQPPPPAPAPTEERRSILDLFRN